MAGAKQFWGVEVKAKESCKVRVDDGYVICVSQATLCDIKKDNEPVIVHVNTGDKKLVMSILSQKTPQISFFLVFNADFEISHNSKNGSIHFMGYQFVQFGSGGSDMEFDSSKAGNMPKYDEDDRNNDDSEMNMATLLSVNPLLHFASASSKDGEDESDDDNTEMVTFDSVSSYESGDSDSDSDSNDDTTPVKSF